MSNIKQIAHDPAVDQLARQQAAQVKEAQQVQNEQELKPGAPSDQDVVQVNAGRADDARLEEDAKLLLDELPEVRSDRVEEAKRKLAAGFYDRPEILKETAGKIAQDLSEPKLASAPQVNAEDVARAKARLALGYYEQPEVLDETAKRIIKKEL